MYVVQCMIFSIVISIAYILSKRSYFVAATVHGVGNVVVGLFYYEVSLSGTVWYSVTAIAVSLAIVGATFGLFGRRFRALYAEQFEQIHADRDKFSVSEAYSS